MTAKDIIYAKLDQIEWWWQKNLMRVFLSETRNRHYCTRCGGIMQYGVKFHPYYDYNTGQPMSVQFIVRCENFKDNSDAHNILSTYMQRSPFLIDYLRSNMYILGAQTILDVYEEES